jgi:hypothetical protein
MMPQQVVVHPVSVVARVLFVAVVRELEPHFPVHFRASAGLALQCQFQHRSIVLQRHRVIQGQGPKILRCQKMKANSLDAVHLQRADGTAWQLHVMAWLIG